MAIFSGLCNLPCESRHIGIVDGVLLPAAHAVGGEEPEEIPTVVLEDILGTYSRSVQIAFERVSDIDSYEEAELAVVDSWLVVTGIPIKEHRWTEAEPEDSKPVEHLRVPTYGLSKILQKDSNN